MARQERPALGRALRHEWLLEPGMDFLNHGSFGATPRRVLRAQDQWRVRMERQPLRFFVDVLPTALRDAAEDLATFLGSRGEHLAFVDNATSGANAVLRSLHLRAGDQILTTNHAYGAVARTIEYVTRRAGAEVVFVDVPFPPASPQDVVERVAGALTERTRIAVLDHVTSATALVLPVQELVALCHDRGVPVLIDGAHAPGMLEVNLEELGADWYTGNCHKWLCSAKGCAFLWTHPDSEVARNDLHPTVISHFLDEEWPMEFDFVGTRDYTPFLSVTEALAFQRELGPRRCRDYMRSLALEAAEMLMDTWSLHFAVLPEMTGSIVTLPTPQHIPACPERAIELTRGLWEEHRIEVVNAPFGERMWIRISAALYNEVGDYRGLAAALAP